MERIHPVVEEGTGREQQDLSGPIRNWGLTLFQSGKEEAVARFLPFDEMG